MKSSEIVDACRFVVAEVQRISALTQKATKETLPALAKEVGISWGLPGKLGRPNYTCGRAADQRLAEISEDRIKTDDALCGRISVDTYYQELSRQIADHALDQDKTVDDALVRMMLAETKTEVMKKLETCRYYFPAFCIQQESLDEFTLGAATFIHTDKFFMQRHADWKESIEKSVARARAASAAWGNETDGAHARELFVETEAELRKYPWLVSVEIENIERNYGWEKARQAVELACTILRLFLQRSANSFIGIADESQLRRHQARFCASQVNEFHPHSVVHWIDIAVSPGFMQELAKAVKRHPALEAVAIKSSKWTPLSPAERRLQAGMVWFGEAWQDRQADARLVKFAICLEGVFMTGNREGITEILAERVALLCEPEYAAIADVYRDVRLVYSGRSKTVHGDAADGKEFVNLSRKAEQIASRGLFAFAELCPYLPTDKTATEALNRFFTALKLGGFQTALETLRIAAQTPPPQHTK